MDYTPRFSQPFSFTEAVNLDFSVITEGGRSSVILDTLTYRLDYYISNNDMAEIARLYNSLVHLRETQKILEAELKSSTERDPEIYKAFEENKVVIGSQEERISMLKMALTDKGLTPDSHYDTPITTPSLPLEGTIPNAEHTDSIQQGRTSSETQYEAEGGVFL